MTIEEIEKKKESHRKRISDKVVASNLGIGVSLVKPL